MEIRIAVTGVDAALARLERVGNIRWAVAPAEAAMRRLEYVMARYPVARLGSKYVRTGVLGKGWTVDPARVVGARVVTKLGNNVEYAPWVQSRMLQARVHRGRWTTEVQAVEQNMSEISALFRAAIERVTR